MDKKNTKLIKFGDTETEKHKFHLHESPLLKNKIDIKVSFGKKGFKYFIGYKDKEKEILTMIKQQKEVLSALLIRNNDY